MEFHLTGDLISKGNSDVYSGELEVQDQGRKYLFTYNMTFPTDINEREKIFEQEGEFKIEDHVSVKYNGKRPIGYEQGYGMIGMFLFMQLDITGESDVPVKFPLDMKGEIPEEELGNQKTSGIRELLKAASNLERISSQSS